MEIAADERCYLTADEERRAFDEMRGGDPRRAAAARERLFLSQARHAAAIALRFSQQTGWEAEDCKAEAWLKLLELLESCDPSRGRLSTLIGASLWRALRAARSQARLIALPAGYTGERHKHHAAARRACRLDSIDADPLLRSALAGRSAGGAGPDELAARREQAERLHRAIDRLPARHRRVVRRRLAGGTFQQIAGELGVSKQRVQQLHAHALGRLRGELREAP